MSWRTIYINSAQMLSLNLNNLQVNYKSDKYNISLDEIGLIIVEDYKAIITTRLLGKLCEEGISVIFTRKNSMPVGSLHSFSDNSRTVKINRIQFNLEKDRRKILWQDIVKIKILAQYDVLGRCGIPCEYLKSYATEVAPGDLTNKEGQAARVYFKKIFGSEFIRFSEDLTNFSLNYTYQVIRSKITQVIISRGLHPPFGIFHRGEYNYFNLSDDLIEPYRPIVDFYVYNILSVYKVGYLTPKLKEELINILNYKIKIGGKVMSISESFKVYVKEIVDFYKGKIENIKVYPQIYDKQV